MVNGGVGNAISLAPHSFSCYIQLFRGAGRNEQIPRRQCRAGVGAKKLIDRNIVTLVKVPRITLYIESVQKMVAI